MNPPPAHASPIVPLTRYEGPVATRSIRVGGGPIEVVRPDDPDRLLDDPTVRAFNAQDDYMPYWAYLWPGAFLLAEAVAREPWKAGTRALEIGCGLGLAGLAGVRAGLHVTFTDYDPAPLDFVARSAAANSFGPDRFAVCPLDWRHLPDEQYPVILGADVTYEHRLIPLVVNLFATLLAPGGLGLVASPYRVSNETLPEALADRGLICESTPMTAESEDLGPLRGTVHRIRRWD